MARIKPMITNKHGLKFTPSEAKNLLNRLEKYNARVERNYNKWIRAGMDPERAKMVAGEKVQVSLDIFRNKGGIKAQIGAMTRRATTARALEKKGEMITGIRILLRDRIGLTTEQLDTIEDALLSMTMVEYQNWWENNKDMIELIFDESENVGAYIISQDYINYVISNLSSSLGVTI